MHRCILIRSVIPGLGFRQIYPVLEALEDDLDRGGRVSAFAKALPGADQRRRKLSFGAVLIGAMVAGVRVSGEIF